MTDLSPAAFAVWDAAWDCRIGHCRTVEESRRHQIAAALRAAADRVWVVKWVGRIPPDASHGLGINWSRDALHAIAAELDGNA